MKMISKIMVGLALALITTISNAAAIAGWNLYNPTPQGASVLFDASKNVAGAVQKSSVSITPNPAEVARVLRGGAAGYALSVAIDQLLGAVDWILDPVNNQIRYKDRDQNDPNGAYSFVFTLYGAYEKSSSIDDVCLKAFKKGGWTGQNIPPLPKGYGCYVLGSSIKAYGPSGELGAVGGVLSNSDKPEKTLPFNDISNKVIENANNNNLDAQSAVLAAAEQILAVAENDSEKAQPIVQQLEDNAKVAGVAPKPNTISHDREKEILDMKPNDPCDEIKQAVKDLDETIQWRKSDLDPKSKGKEVYVGHQKRIKILRDKKDDLDRAYKVWCEG